jgi:hypothetical protein
MLMDTVGDSLGGGVPVSPEGLGVSACAWAEAAPVSRIRISKDKEVIRRSMAID